LRNTIHWNVDAYDTAVDMGYYLIYYLIRQSIKWDTELDATLS